MNLMTSQSILIIGCGDVGFRLIRWLKHQQPQRRVWAIVRRSAQASAVRLAGGHPIVCDLDHASAIQLRNLARLSEQQVYLAPPSPQQQGDPRLARWLIALAQIQSSRDVQSKSVRLVYVSTTGVYGDCQGAWVNELTRVAPQTARAKRRVAAEKMIAHYMAQGVLNGVILRVPGIYAENRLPLTRLQQHLPLPDADIDAVSYSNHIHALDLARLCAFVLQRKVVSHRLSACKPLILNACDSQWLSVRCFYDELADAVGLPRCPSVTWAEARTVLSPMQLSFLAESRRISNQRIRGLGFRLRYPSVRDCFARLKCDAAIFHHQE
jgi:nucleoside-diphosphate-sugar epimerase